MTYFEIGVYHPKTSHNIGTLWRSAYQLGAAGVFTIGQRYKKQASDTFNVPNMIPLRHYESLDEFKIARPVGGYLVGIEMGGIPLSEFIHPTNYPTIYLLGAEDHGIPPEVLKYCNAVVSLEAINGQSYNVAVAGSIVMYDRVFGK